MAIKRYAPSSRGGSPTPTTGGTGGVTRRGGNPIDDGDDGYNGRISGVGGRSGEHDPNDLGGSVLSINDAISDPQAFAKLIGQLARMSQNGSNSIEDLLASLRLNAGNMTQDIANDVNKQLLDQLINLALTKENRSYNEGLRDEQRLYDNPLNQLARLMGAGISRDAAIQMLSGSGGSGGSGVPYSEPAADAQSAIPASQSNLNGAQAHALGVSNALNGVFGAISAVTGLVNLGLSIPQALSQIQLSRNSAYLSSAQRKAYDAASGAFTVISAAGLESTDKIFGSIDNTVSTIESLAKTGNAAAQAFIDTGGVDALRTTSPYSAPFLSQLYKDNRAATDHASMFATTIRQMSAQTDLARANIDKIVGELQLIQPQIDELHSRANYQDAIAKLTGSQKTQVDLENQIQQAFLDTKNADGRTGLELFTDQRIQQLSLDVATLSALNDADAYQLYADEILAQKEDAIALYDLSILYSEGELDAVDNSNDQFYNTLMLCRAADKSGLFDYVHAKVEASSGRHLSGPLGIGIDIGVAGGQNELFSLKGNARRNQKLPRRGRRSHLYD